MIDTIIVSGGNIQSDFALDFLKKTINETGREHLCLIAADRGMDFFIETAEAAGIRPDIAVGDFDSLSEKGRHYLERSMEHTSMEAAHHLEIYRLKPEKDDSDTQSAAVLAMKRGRKNIAILGATGSRLDHVMANLGLLSLGRNYGANITLLDACNYITLVESGTRLERTGQFGKYVSFFPVGGDVDGLTLRGFKYPLDGYRLTAADSGLTVSNEIQDEWAEVQYERGSLLMIMSRD
ncbi:thiamine diphosphokinase [Blautia sp. HCP3S3_G3]|uniref:thiamine diphosphokinase n=1 Tax=Blautia sp. HCP3S3_G3 TaxID=3438913 RepID=UPI003F892348